MIKKGFKISTIKSQAAFTLIELLVTISIIGILAGIATYSFTGARAQARDGQRKADLKQIQSALELYKADHGTYPQTNWRYSFNGGWMQELVSGGYLKSNPTDPKGGSYYYAYYADPAGTANTSTYCYYATGTPTPSGSYYILLSVLESTTDPAANKAASLSAGCYWPVPGNPNAGAGVNVLLFGNP